jgi:hypothetical protein
MSAALKFLRAWSGPTRLRIVALPEPSRNQLNLEACFRPGPRRKRLCQKRLEVD